MKLIPKLQNGTWPSWWTNKNFQSALSMFPYNFKAGDFWYQYPKPGLENRDRSSEFNNFINRNFKLVGYTQNQDKQWIQGAPLVGGKNSTYPYLYKPTGQGDYKDLERQSFYKTNVETRIDENGELTPMGRFFIDKYISNLDPNNKTRLALEEFKKNNYKFKGFDRNNKYLGSWKDFFDAVSFDNKGGPGHNVVQDFLPYNADTGTGELDNESEVFDSTEGLREKGFRPLQNYVIKGINGPIQPSYYNRKKYGTNYGGERWYKIGDVNTSIPGEDDRFTVDNNYLNTIKDSLVINNPNNINNDSNNQGKSEILVLDPDNRKRGISRLLGNIGLGLNNLKLNKETSPFVDQALRTIADNIFNTWNTNKLIKDMDVPLLHYTPSFREVHGDYIAQKQAEQQAARLRNQRPVTSNAEVQSAIDQEAIQKGNQLIQQGNLQDAQMYRQTSEAAWTQSKENVQGWNNIANTNRQALSQFKNKIAELKFNTRQLNMQNIDTLLSDREKRKWQDYDYARLQKRQAEDAVKDIELENNMYDQEYYDKYNEYQPLASMYWSDRSSMTPDQKSRYSELLQWMNNDQVRRKYQQLFNVARRYGINYNLPSQFTTTPNGKVIYRQLDGGILKFQLGGVKSASSFTPSGSVPTYREKDVTKDSSSATKESSKEKDINSLKKDIAETLKGIKGNPSDVNKLHNYLIEFFSTQQFSPTSSINDLYLGYVNALRMVNDIQSGYETTENAYKRMDRKDSLNSPVMDANGNVYVGVAGTSKIQKVTAEEYLADVKSGGGKYQLLYNSSLIALRKDHDQFAFQDGLLLEAEANGTNLSEINKYIKDVVGNLGKDTQSKDMLVRTLGPQAVQGLQTLVQLTQEGLSDAQTSQIIASLNSLTELNLTTESQEKQVESALNSIMANMPKNMYSMLLLQAGSKEGVQKLITSMILKGVNSSAKFTVKDFNTLDENGSITGSKSKGSSSGEPKEEAQDQFLKQLQKGNGGERETVRLNPGTKSEMSQVGVNYYVGQAGSLNDMLEETKIKSIADSRKIYFGDQLVDPVYLDDIAFLNRGITRVILPIKNDGSPDFEIFERFDKVCDRVREKGYQPFGETDEQRKVTAQKLLAEELNAEGLYGLINNGVPDLRRVGLFITADCWSSNKAGIHASNFVEVLSNPDYTKFKSLLSKKGPDGKFKEYEIDEDSYWISDWFGFHDNLYQGTVYIPISNNELQASIGSGNKIKDSTAYRYEEQKQRWDNIRKSGRNPDQNSSDKLNLNETE